MSLVTILSSLAVIVTFCPLWTPRKLATSRSVGSCKGGSRCTPAHSSSRLSLQCLYQQDHHQRPMVLHWFWNSWLSDWFEMNSSRDLHSPAGWYSNVTPNLEHSEVQFWPAGWCENFPRGYCVINDCVFHWDSVLHVHMTGGVATQSWFIQSLKAGFSVAATFAAGSCGKSLYSWMRPDICFCSRSRAILLAHWVQFMPVNIVMVSRVELSCHSLSDTVGDVE